MLRAPWPFLAAAFLALAQSAHAWQRAITRTGERIGIEDQIPEFGRSDFSDVVIDPALQQLVDRLASDDYAQREEATNALFEKEFDRQQIYAILTQQELNAEQRHRLLSCVIAQLLNTPRGAVGIQMSWVTEAFGEAGYVLIQRTIPGFDAAQVLQFHDRVTHVDNTRLMQDGDFARLVQSKRPGEEVALTIQRAKRAPEGHLLLNPDGGVAYESLDVSIKLGSLEVLKNMPGENRVVEAGNDEISREMRWALARFVAPRRTIAVDGEFPELTIDNHPEIRTIQHEVELYLAGRIRNIESMHRTWLRKLEQLDQEALKPELSEEEREFCRLVAQRYEELMTEALTPREAP